MHNWKYGAFLKVLRLNRVHPHRSPQTNPKLTPRNLTVKTKQSLTILAAATPGPAHAFDAPALFLGALWLPYRRARAGLRAAVAAAAEAVESGAAPPIAAVATPLPWLPRFFGHHSHRWGG